MKNKGFRLGILVMVLVFGILVAGCDDGGSTTSTVSTVSVSATGNATTVLKGDTLQFRATVNGTNNPSQTVTWSIDEISKKAGTTISGGLLTVAVDEILTSLTVRATSTVNTSKSGTKQIFITVPSPVVSTVTVSSAGNATTILKGDSLQFSATVNGTNNPSQTVIWSIDEIGKKVGTTISGGLLTVAVDEILTSLTVRATSTVDTSKGGTKQVTLTAPPVSGISGDYIYNGTTDGVTITDYTGMITDLEIPSTLDGYSVTAIGNNAFKSKNLTSVTIPDSVITIGSGAFNGNKLTNVILGNGIRSISTTAFQGNSTISGYVSINHLKSVTIGANVNLATMSFNSDYDYGTSRWGFTEAYNSNGQKAGTYILSSNRWTINGEIIHGQIPAPSSVTAVGTSGFRVNVSWSSVPGATSYDVYYQMGNTSAEMRLAGNFTETSCTVNVGSNMYAFFYVRSKNPAFTSDFASASRTQASP